MKPNQVSKKNNYRTGVLGEKVAREYLLRNGYYIIMQNYRKPWAEIDIICKKDDIVHFVEVKSVPYETRVQLENAISRETWQPEELVHSFKLKQISKGVQSWLHENSYTGNFQIDVAVVRIVPRETYARVKLIDNVLVEQ